jgi:hypothetical protein
MTAFHRFRLTISSTFDGTVVQGRARHTSARSARGRVRNLNRTTRRRPPPLARCVSSRNPPDGGFSGSAGGASARIFVFSITFLPSDTRPPVVFPTLSLTFPPPPSPSLSLFLDYRISSYTTFTVILPVFGSLGAEPNARCSPAGMQRRTLRLSVVREDAT